MEKQLNELQAMFPSLEMGIIALMLRECNNDVNTTVEKLLMLTDSDVQTSSAQPQPYMVDEFPSLPSNRPSYAATIASSTKKQSINGASKTFQNTRQNANRTESAGNWVGAQKTKSSQRRANPKGQGGHKRGGGSGTAKPGQNTARSQNAQKRSKSGGPQNAHHSQPKPNRTHHHQQQLHVQQQQQKDFTDPSASLLPAYYDQGQPYYDEQGHLYYLPANFPGYYYGGMQQPESLFAGDQLDWMGAGYPEVDYFQTGYGLNDVQEYPQPLLETSAASGSIGISSVSPQRMDDSKNQWPVGMPDQSSLPLVTDRQELFDLDDVSEGAQGSENPCVERDVQHSDLKKRLIILRGLPGSGKTTLARELVGDLGVICSTDSFFMVNGEYVYDSALLGEYHDKNKKKAANAMKKGRSPVIIDNTNTSQWEMKPYVVMGLDFGYEPEILEPDTPWKCNVAELSRRTEHKVPRQIIERMLERHNAEQNITIDSILASQQPEKKDFQTANKERQNKRESFSNGQRYHDQTEVNTNPESQVDHSLGNKATEQHVPNHRNPYNRSNRTQGQNARSGKNDNYRQSNHRDRASASPLKRPAPKQSHPRRSHSSAASPAPRRKEKLSYDQSQGSRHSSTNSKSTEMHTERSSLDGSADGQCIVHDPIDSAGMENVSSLENSLLPSNQKDPEQDSVAERSKLSTEWAPSVVPTEWSLSAAPNEQEADNGRYQDSKPASTAHITSEVWSSFDISDVKVQDVKRQDVNQLDLWKTEFQSMAVDSELPTPSVEMIPKNIDSHLRTENEPISNASKPSIEISNPPLIEAVHGTLDLYPGDSDSLFHHSDNHNLMAQEDYLVNEHQAFPVLPSGGTSTNHGSGLDSALSESLASETALRRRVMLTPDRDYSDPLMIHNPVISEKTPKLAPTPEVFPTNAVSSLWEYSTDLPNEEFETEQNSSSSASVEEIFEEYYVPESPSLISQSLGQALMQADTSEVLYTSSAPDDHLPSVGEESDVFQTPLSDENFPKAVGVNPSSVLVSAENELPSEESETAVVSFGEDDPHVMMTSDSSESPFEEPTLKEESLSDECNSGQYVFPSAYISESQEESLNATLSPEIDGNVSTPPQSPTAVSSTSLEQYNNEKHPETKPADSIDNDILHFEAEMTAEENSEVESIQLEDGIEVEAVSETASESDSQDRAQTTETGSESQSISQSVDEPRKAPTTSQLLINGLNPNEVIVENEPNITIEVLNNELGELDEYAAEAFITEAEDISSDLMFLMECFPDLEPSYLQHLYLQSCGSNVEDAVSCALLTATEPSSQEKEAYFNFPFSHFDKESSPSADEVSDTLSSSCEVSSEHQTSRSRTAPEESISDTTDATGSHLRQLDQNTKSVLGIDFSRMENEEIFDCMSDEEIARALQEELDKEVAEIQHEEEAKTKLVLENNIATDLKSDASLETSALALQSNCASTISGSEGICDEDNLVLKLTPSLARQLQAMFGSIYEHLPFEGNMREKDLEVLLSERAARQIYRKWMDTLEAKKIEMQLHSELLIHKDEKLTRELQTAERSQHRARNKHRHFSAPTSEEEEEVKRSCHSEGLAQPLEEASPRGKGLSEIIDEQLAQNFGDQEATELLHSKCNSNFSRKLQLKHLHSQFPQIEQRTINRMLVQNKFDFQATTAQLQVEHSTETADGNASSHAQNDRKSDVDVTQSKNVGKVNSKNQKRRKFATGSKVSLVHTQRKSPSKISVRKIPQDDQLPKLGQSPLQSLEDLPSYNNLRAEAALHAKLRAENFQKAAHARSKKQWELATYYAQQGHMHTGKMKEANQRAAGFILTLNQDMSDTLDMHGLHVSEALEALKDKVTNAQAGKSVYVITGRGSHSKGREARIKPAVLHFLKQNGYRFEETNAGMLKVTARK